MQHTRIQISPETRLRPPEAISVQSTPTWKNKGTSQSLHASWVRIVGFPKSRQFVEASASLVCPQVNSPELCGASSAAPVWPFFSLLPDLDLGWLWHLGFLLCPLVPSGTWCPLHSDWMAPSSRPGSPRPPWDMRTVRQSPRWGLYLSEGLSETTKESVTGCLQERATSPFMN